MMASHLLLSPFRNRAIVLALLLIAGNQHTDARTARREFALDRLFRSEIEESRNISAIVDQPFGRKHHGEPVLLIDDSVGAATCLDLRSLSTQGSRTGELETTEQHCYLHFVDPTCSDGYFSLSGSLPSAVGW